MDSFIEGQLFNSGLLNLFFLWYIQRNTFSETLLVICTDTDLLQKEYYFNLICDEHITKNMLTFTCN